MKCLEARLLKIKHSYNIAEKILCILFYFLNKVDKKLYLKYTYSSDQQDQT